MLYEVITDIGYKYDGGVRTEQVAVRVHVREKIFPVSFILQKKGHVINASYQVINLLGRQADVRNNFV